MPGQRSTVPPAPDASGFSSSGVQAGQAERPGHPAGAPEPAGSSEPGDSRDRDAKTVQTDRPDRTGLLAPVGLIAPFPDLAGLGYEALQAFTLPVEIRVGDMAKGLAEARSLKRQGVEVFISRGGTANLIHAKLDVPVVNVRTSAYDILTSLKPYIGSGKRIGLLGNEVMFLGAQRLRTLFGLDVHLYSFSDFSQMPGLIEQAAADGMEVMVGGRHSMRLAGEAGMEVILLSAGYEAVLTAFHEAYQMLDVFRSESARLARQHTVETRFEAVLHAVREPIWIVDPGGAVQLSNPAAAALMGGSGFGGTLPLHPPGVLGQLCAATEPQEDVIARLGGKPLLLDSMPLHTGGKRSVLIMGRSATKIEQSERTLRSAVYAKGHVARYRFTDILGQDPGFMEVIEKARVYAPSPSTVLITGETGTGKELFAQSMHNASSGERPFVAVNCATLPETMLESELFGYDGGAFTGARQEGRKGLFELAHGGSILLDEIGEMPLALQSRLLRVLEERAVRPLGGDRVIPVDVRLMATTNANLEQAVAEGTFRRDLFYRLNVLSLKLPPLRDRGEDPVHIFRIFVARRNPQADVEALLGSHGRELLLRHAWPGNLRELHNLVEKLGTLTCGFTGRGRKLPDLLREELRPEAGAGALAPAEVDILEQLVQGGAIKQHKLAELLGVSRTTLWRRSRRGNHSG